MAAPTIGLNTSLRQLNDITKRSYNDHIRDVALEMWKKHLSPKNPQWQYIRWQSFYVSNKNGRAHVMAMLDKRLPGKGIVGYFACTSAQAGATALQKACDWLLSEHGIHDVYGPINGTLPSDYRLNLADDYAFPGEPVNPKWHINAFEQAGFTVFNRYASGRLRHFHMILKFAFRKPKQRYAHIRVRPFNSAGYDADFKTYHELRNQIFPFMSIYCPAISLKERIYNASGKFDAAYTYFLVDENREVGFVMAYEFKGQLILKTIGLLPEYRGKGLSSLLLKTVHDQAARAGLKTAVYSMVREGNRIHQNRHPFAKVFRRYVTMHKAL